MALVARLPPEQGEGGRGLFLKFVFKIHTFLKFGRYFTPFVFYHLKKLLPY
jgi:hypothetical protein